MASHVVAATAEFPPGTRRVIEIDGRAVVVFNVKGEYFALLDKCPHNGGSLAAGVVTGLLQSAEPGCYSYAREGEIIRCPWHGWEFDIKTGRSFCSVIRARARAFPVHIEPGQTIVEGPYRAETVPVRVEDDYVVVDA
ncbi:MAG: 2Fe-2S ferredoxin [Devosia sp. 67-54]|uniref:Rieske (2Fe-2S) protein n=1 Tax=unclassified Devosia TaxID=196773 RepID=UPI00086EE084|nr:MULTISPECIES: Rieske (2Fe-2S) protein [unclassified Devosia]MBN9306039.1 Rieske (2Fe-2S) protein [Devosia sp.]ODU54170.1 MAG: 2Fe-2S ferredoxin [Acetobacteraceae bacterium SCN 69-10]OJX16288.1 MAG: 2Fe-2S ferredoxin [Devosia sp. 67-54]